MVHFELMNIKEILNKVKNDYDKIAEDFHLTRTRMWPEFEAVKNVLFPHAKLLDCGCGNGRLAVFLKNANIDYVGTDSSKNLLRFARKQINKNDDIQAKFIQQDILSKHLPRKAFDVVCSFAVLHHIPTPSLQKKALANMRRAIKAGGTFIVTVWNLRQKHYRRFIQKNKHAFIPWGADKKVTRFYYAFTVKELKALLLKSDFVKIRRLPSISNISFICKIP